jgi:Tol biopolymer transport system component
MKTVIKISVLMVLLLSFYACDSDMNDGAVLILPLRMGLYASPDWGAEDIHPGGLIVFTYEDYGLRCLCLFYCNEYGSVIGQIPTADDYDPFDVSEPSWAPSRMEVVCKVDNAYTMEEGLYICDASGNLKLLVAGEFCGSPNWSPDGSRIAYLLYELYEDYEYVYNLFVIDADGGTPTRLTTTGVRSFDWFPDGERIIYETFQSGDHVLVALDVDSGVETELYINDNYMDDVVVSPDGEYVAYSFNPPGETPRDIYVLNIKTEEIRRVTAEKIPPPEENPIPMMQGAFSPIWSPDGKSMAFLSTRRNYNGYDLYKIRVFE